MIKNCCFCSCLHHCQQCHTQLRIQEIEYQIKQLNQEKFWLEQKLLPLYIQPFPVVSPTYPVTHPIPPFSITCDDVLKKIK